MLGNNFYYGIIRKYVTYFGSLFNDIVIERVDSSDNVTKSLTVPINYGPRNSYITRLEQNDDLQRNINQLLPRMSFAIDNIMYDNTRKLPTTQKIFAQTTSGYEYTLQPVPYNFNIDLYIYTKNANDGTAIVEQILPFFTPDFTSRLILIPELNISKDITLILNGVSLDDNFQDGFDQNRLITWKLNFLLKGFLYGPSVSSNVIKTVNINFRGVGGNNTIDTAIGNTSISDYIISMPGLTANGQPTSNAQASIPYQDIQANSNYGYILDFMSNIK